MATNIHPTVFLYHQKCKYASLIKELVVEYYSEFNDLIICRDYNITIKDLIRFKPDRETKVQYAKDGVILSNPFIISFIDIVGDENSDEYFSFWEKLKEFPDFNEGEQTDYYFFNAIIRDLNRELASDLKDKEFYLKFEQYFKDWQKKDLYFSLSTFYNLILDVFNSKTEKISQRIEFVFVQFMEQMKLLVRSESLVDLDLTHCSNPSPNRLDDSPIRYNTIGSAAVGFDQDKVLQYISLLRKKSFISELVAEDELTDDKKYKLYTHMQGFFYEHFAKIEDEFQKNRAVKNIDLTFQKSFEFRMNSFYNAHSEINNNGDEGKLKSITNEIFNAIDESQEKFQPNIDRLEQEDVTFSQKRGKELEQTLIEKLKYLFDLGYTGNLNNDDDMQFVASDSIKTAIYCSNLLLKEPDVVQLVIQKDKVYNSITLSNKKNTLIASTKESSKKEDCDRERNGIKSSVDQIDSNISRSYRKIADLKSQLSVRWRTKSFINLIVIPFGSFLFSLIIGTIYLWIVDDLLYSLIVSGIFTASGTTVGIIKALLLKKELQKEKEVLGFLTQEKYQLVHQYMNTYNKYFNEILEQKRYEMAVKVVGNSIDYVKIHLDTISSFNDSFNRFKKKYEKLCADFSLGNQSFYQSILNKKDVEYYCTTQKLTYFDKKKISDIFESYLNVGNDLILPNYTDFTDKVEENEIIKANKRVYDQQTQEYSCINGEKTKLFLTGENESKEILFSDVKQGQVGDCYFVAALSGIAHKQAHYIKNIINHDKGIYEITFFGENSKKYKVCIDNKFWIEKETKSPVYAKFGSTIEDVKELWPMVIEKAWAKINGKDYSNINGTDKYGELRKIDYSLALSGKKAIYEHITPEDSSNDYHIRIKNHLLESNKPIILYSNPQEHNESCEEFIKSHAFTLLDVTEKTYVIYNPHGNSFEIPIENLKYNFDTILYFDFDFKEDEHLSDYYREYFIKNYENYISRNFDKLIRENDWQNIKDNSLESLLNKNVFNITLDLSQKKNFAREIVENSDPIGFIFKGNYSKIITYMVGKNKVIGEDIVEALKQEGIDTKKMLILEESEKRIGILKIKNNLNMQNVTRD